MKAIKVAWGNSLTNFNNNNNMLVFDSKLTITIFSACMAIILSCVYFLLRVGFPNPIIPVLKTLSISLYFICFPCFYRLISKSFSGSDDKATLTTDAFISLGNLLIIISIAYFSPVFPFDIFPFLGTVGIIIFLILFKTWLGKGNWKPSITFLIISTIFSILMAARIWYSGYVNPLFVENIILDTSHMAHMDTLHHAAITGMIKTYGIPSTGLDGIPFRAYHFGSHWLFAQLSKLLNLRTIDFYQLGYPVIFIPWLLQCMLLFALELNSYYKNMMRLIDLRNNVVFWLVFWLFLLEWTPVSRFTWREGIHTVSQSYMVSLICAFLFLSVGLNLITNREKIGKYSWQIVTFIITIPGLICFAALTKVSVGFLLICVYMYMLYRMNCYKKILPNISIIITLLITIPVILIINSGQVGLKIVPFNIIISHTIKLLIVFSCQFLSWLFIAYRLYETHSVTAKEFVNNVKTNQIMDVEVIALLCFLGVAPFFIIQESGGGEFYFTDIQNMVAISFILANLPKIVGLIREWIFQTKLIKNIVIALSLLCFAVVSIFILTPVKKLIESNLRTRIAYYYMSVGYDPKNVKEISKFDKENVKDFSKIFRKYMEIKGLAINYRINDGSLSRLIDAVKNDLIFRGSIRIDDVRVKMINNIYDLGMMGAAEKKKTIIFIPQSNRLYWELLTDIYKRRTPFLVPAISEIALIKGLPTGLSEEEIKSMGYGYMSYKFPQKQQAAGITLDKICQEAISKGFSQLVVINAKNQEYKIDLANFN